MSGSTQQPLGWLLKNARDRRAIGLLIAVLLLMVIQSITITLPIRAELRDAYSRQSVAGAKVVVVWQLEAGNFGGYSPGDILKVRHETSDARGHLYIGPAFIVHSPLAPFSFQLRSRRYLPQIFIMKDGYYSKMQSSLLADRGSSAPMSFIMFRRSGLNGRTIDLTPRAQPTEDSSNDRYGDAMVQSSVKNSLARCQRMWYCQFE